MKSDQEAQIYLDGGARGNPGPAAVGYVIKSPEGKTLQARGEFIGRTTNNVAEYTALIKALQAAIDLEKREVDIFSDSELLVKQIIGEYRVRNHRLGELYEQAQKLLLEFDRWQIRHIRREGNAEADALVNQKLDEALGLSEPSVEPIVGDPTSKPGGPAAAGQGKVLVELTAGPAAGACSAGMNVGQCFVFSNVAPAGMCLHAMQALLPAVVGLQVDPALADGDKLTVRCRKTDCGAVFELNVLG